MKRREHARRNYIWVKGKIQQVCLIPFRREWKDQKRHLKYFGQGIHNYTKDREHAQVGKNFKKQNKLFQKI